MQLNFSRRKKVFIRLDEVAIEKETSESIFLSGHPIIHVSFGRGEPLRKFRIPERIDDAFELPIKYKERINKLLGEHHQEPVVFEL